MAGISKVAPVRVINRLKVSSKEGGKGKVVMKKKSNNIKTDELDELPKKIDERV